MTKIKTASYLSMMKETDVDNGVFIYVQTSKGDK